MSTCAAGVSRAEPTCEYLSVAQNILPVLLSRSIWASTRTMAFSVKRFGRPMAKRCNGIVRRDGTASPGLAGLSWTFLWQQNSGALKSSIGLCKCSTPSATSCATSSDSAHSAPYHRPQSDGPPRLKPWAAPHMQVDSLNCCCRHFRAADGHLATRLGPWPQSPIRESLRILFALVNDHIQIALSPATHNLIEALDRYCPTGPDRIDDA